MICINGMSITLLALVASLQLLAGPLPLQLESQVNPVVHLTIFEKFGSITPYSITLADTLVDALHIKCP